MGCKEIQLGCKLQCGDIRDDSVEIGELGRGNDVPTSAPSSFRNEFVGTNAWLHLFTYWCSEDEIGFRQIQGDEWRLFDGG